MYLVVQFLVQVVSTQDCLMVQDIQSLHLMVYTDKSQNQQLLPVGNWLQLDQRYLVETVHRCSIADRKFQVSFQHRSQHLEFDIPLKVEINSIAV